MSTATTNASTNRCPVCNKESTKICSRCKSVWYCSVDHQHQDWKRHKPTCMKSSMPVPPRLPVAPKLDPGTERFYRIKYEGYHRNDPVSFTIETTNTSYLFNTEQYCDEGLLEHTCGTFSELLTYLLLDYLEILNTCKSVNTPPVRTPLEKKHFLFLPDNNPQQGQDPFLIIEYLNYDIDVSDRKYYHTIQHFVRDVVLSA